MADPVPLAPGVPLLIPVAATYCNYYQDDSHNRAGGNYGTIMDAFMVPIAGADLTPNQAFEAVFSSAVMDPQAFVMLITDANHPEGYLCLYLCL
jgi:hypothetical protein